MTDKQNFKDLCNLTTELVGLPKGSLSKRSREHKYQIPRAAICVIARQEEGINKYVIGAGIKRDRTSINHYEKKHKSDYKTFPAYRKVFIDLYIAYCSHKKQKLYFKTQKDFQDLLDKNNIKSSTTYNTELVLRSGDFYVVLQLSHQDFYNVIEIIKFALKEHHYEYKVI